MRDPVYRVWVDGVARNSYPGDVWTSTGIGPLHKSCAIYSAIHCPYMKYPTSVRRLQDGSPRGHAIITGHRRHGLYFHSEPISGWAGHAWSHCYVDAVESIHFETWRDLIPAYEDAITEKVDVSTRLFWHTPNARPTGKTRFTAPESPELDKLWRHDSYRLNHLRGTASIWVGDRLQRIALL